MKGTEVIHHPQKILFYCYQRFSPRRRREGRIKTDLQEVGCARYDWIDLAQDKGELACTCECGNEPSGSVKCGEFLD